MTSSKTTIVQVNVNPSRLPGKPGNLSASVVSRPRIDLSSTDNASNESNYQIARCAGATCTNFVQIATVGGNVTSHSNTGLRRDTSYRFRVRAYNASGHSVYSHSAAAKTLG